MPIRPRSLELIQHGHGEVRRADAREAGSIDLLLDLVRHGLVIALLPPK